MIDSAVTNLALSPLLPWGVLAPLFALTAAGLMLALWRRARGTLWRCVAMAMLAAALLNPSLVHEQRAPIKDVAVIVVDQSPSQSIGERQTRTETALAQLQDKLKTFDDLDVRVVRSEAGEVDETRLFDALGHAIADIPKRRIAGTILLTDGQVHDVPADLKEVSDIGPIHTLLSGEHAEKDRRLTIVQAPPYGIVGKSVTLTVRVDDLPEGTAVGAVPLSFSQDGKPPQIVDVPVGRETAVEIPVTHGGQNVVELSVPEMPGELSLANNRAALIINGVRDRLRVLLVSGEPHAGERTWRNLLKADPAVDLVHFTILRPPEKQDATPVKELSLIAFPIRELFEIKLNEFDLIIFDRYRRRGVLPTNYLENVASYVEHGGALLEVSGPGFASPFSLAHTPLGAVLPTEPTGDIIEQGFRPHVTALGRRHPVTAGLSGDVATGEPHWGRWFRQAGVMPVDGDIVMSGVNDKPLLMLRHYGQGRVAQLLSDQIWLWSRGFEGGGPQAELLRRLAHWLMKEPELEENDLRAHADGKRITVERRSLKPDTRTVTMTNPAGETQTLALAESKPGLDSASVVADAPGIYRFTDGERTALAVVGALNPPELQDMRTTEDKLASVAEATGGGIFWIVDHEDGVDIHRTNPTRDQSGPAWLGLRANGDYTVTGVNEVPLLPAALVLAVVIGGMMLGWRREGR